MGVCGPIRGILESAGGDFTGKRGAVVVKAGDDSPKCIEGDVDGPADGLGIAGLRVGQQTDGNQIVDVGWPELDAHG